MKYNDISPRTAAYADRRLLERAKTNNILGQFGQSRTLPTKSSKTAIFRRYNRLAAATAQLLEGVTPSGKTSTKTDVLVNVNQYGDFVQITDVIEDTHEDPVLKENIDILAEQASDTFDILRAGILVAGTNVIYANGTARSSVNTIISNTLLETIKRTLKRQEAKPIKGIITAGPSIGTSPIAAAFIVVSHTDLEKDIVNLTGYKSVEEYASTKGLIEGEIGACRNFRFVIDNNLTPWPDAGGAKGNMLSTSGTLADVYPVLIFGRDAYGIVSLGGKNAVRTYVNNPKAITGDELAQRGSVGWKGWHGAGILNDLWMARLECSATA